MIDRDDPVVIDRDDPVVVVGRPRSGTRVVAALLGTAGYFLGADLADRRLDSLSWYQRFVAPLVTSRFFPGWPEDPELDLFVEERLRDTWPRYLGDRALPRRWGWKYPETLFTLPLLLRRFPRMRVVHLVRDGRDVCASRGGFFQATGPLADPPGWDPPEAPPWARRPDATDARPRYREFSAAVTFGDAGAVCWRGIDLADPVARLRNRFLIGMQAWAFAVETGQAYGAALGGQYREVRYEQLCAEPVATAAGLLGWLGEPVTRAVTESAAELVRVDRAGAWRRAVRTASERRDFDAAVAFGADLLAVLGDR